MLTSHERQMVRRLGRLELLASHRAGLFRVTVVVQIGFSIVLLAGFKAYSQSQTKSAANRTVHVAVGPAVAAADLATLQQRLPASKKPEVLFVPANDPAAEVRAQRADLGIVGSQPWSFVADPGRLPSRIALGRARAAVAAAASGVPPARVLDLSGTDEGRRVLIASLAGLLVITVAGDIVTTAIAAFGASSVGTRAESLLILPLRHRVLTTAKVIGLVPTVAINAGIAVVVSGGVATIARYPMSAAGLAGLALALVAGGLGYLAIGSVLGTVCRTPGQIAIANGAANLPFLLITIVLVSQPIGRVGLLAGVPIIGPILLARAGLAGLASPVDAVTVAVVAVATLAAGLALASNILGRSGRVLRPT